MYEQNRLTFVAESSLWKIPNYATFYVYGFIKGQKGVVLQTNKLYKSANEYIILFKTFKINDLNDIKLIIMMITFCKPEIYHCHRKILGLMLTRFMM
jgi:hypothetical protein